MMHLTTDIEKKRQERAIGTLLKDSQLKTRKILATNFGCEPSHTAIMTAFSGLSIPYSKRHYIRKGVNMDRLLKNVISSLEDPVEHEEKGCCRCNSCLVKQLKIYLS